MLRFLSNDFSQPRWRTAALKNAYALLAKQRFGEYTQFSLPPAAEYHQNMLLHSSCWAIPCTML
jgi:hypothetical protein